MKLKFFSAVLVLGLALALVQGQEKVISDVDYSPSKFRADYVFSRCSLAKHFASTPETFGPAHHPGFWTCLSVFNSAHWGSETPSFSHKCGYVNRGKGKTPAIRCAHDYYGIFNLGDDYGWCAHKHPFKNDPVSANRKY